jgi:hypothetical protein
MMGAFQVSVSSIQAQNGPSLLSATAGDCVEAQAPTVGTKVRFFDRYKPPQVPCWGATGVIVEMEERPAPNSGSDYWVRVRFGDFITPWIEAWQLERVR